MSNQRLKLVLQGISLALLVYLASSTIVPLILPVHAQQAPLFSVTLLASTGNPVRRQYASIITRNLIAMGIDAKLFYLPIDSLINRLTFENIPQGTTFDQGGYDMGFLLSGYTMPVPDIRTYYSSSSFAPNGWNDYLFNNTEVDKLFAELYSSSDQATQVKLMWQVEAILAQEKPAAFIYEPKDVVPRAQKWTDFGVSDKFSALTFPDIQHWSGGNELDYAQAGNVFPGGNLDPAYTAPSSTAYAVPMWYPIFSGSGLQDVDLRTMTYYNALATNITTSADGLTWTVHFRSGVNFQDGVEVTADDFLFTIWANLNPNIASTNLGTSIQNLGNVVDFTWLNGTTTTLNNAQAGGTLTHGWWKSLDRYTIQFHLPTPYSFARQIYAGFASPGGIAGPLPKHLMEQFDPSTWDSAPFSTAVAPYTYTWDTKKYGGNGTYTAFGPVGAGPYKMVSFDSTTNTAVLKKWPGYWNTTGLEALGQFTIDTYKLIWINDKDSALADFKNGDVNMLDEFYSFNANDLPTLTAMGANPVQDPEPYWQELQFNLRHPIWGTGVDTPLGQSDPSRAAEAARDVRDAISHLIPRQLIVDSLLGGMGTPLAGPFGPACGVWTNTNLTVDSFDMNAAAADLQAAGYTVNVTPPAQITSSGSTLLGTGSITLSGTTGVSRMMVIIQQSTDNMTWTPIAATVANNSTNYQVTVPGSPAFGSVMYRANFTGYTAPNETIAMAPMTPDLVNQLINSGQTGGSKRLIPESVTNTITVSSATNDTMAVSAIVLVIVLIAAITLRMRKKKQAP